MKKKVLLLQWVSQSIPTCGPALAGSIEKTEKRNYGAFKINFCNRQQLAKECSAHIECLLIELDKGFAPSPVLLPVQKVRACNCFLNNSRTKWDSELRFSPIDSHDDCAYFLYRT
jgi:hypothetical protein